MGMKLHSILPEISIQIPPDEIPCFHQTICRVTLNHRGARGSGHGEDSKVPFQFQSLLSTWMPNPFSFLSSQLDFHQASDHTRDMSHACYNRNLIV